MASVVHDGGDDVQSYVSGLKVVELRDELKKRGVSSYGVKSVLAERLIDAMKSEKNDASKGEENESSPSLQDDENGDVVNKEAEVETESESKEVAAEIEPNQDEPSAHAQNSEVEATSSSAAEDEQQAAKEEEEVANKSDEPDKQPETIKQDEETTVEEQANSNDQGDSTSDDAVVTVEEDSGAPPATEQEQEPMEASSSEEQPPRQETVEVLESVEGEGDSERESTSRSEEPSEGRGYKRERDREDKERERPRRFDPRHAADPEQPMQFNEEKMKGLVTSKFVPPSDSSTITLDPYNSSLYFNIDEDGMGGCGLTEEGFQYLWAGARSTWGVKSGRYYYDCKVEDEVVADLPDSEDSYHDVRVGWSILSSDSTVGDGQMSCAYCKNGTFVFNGHSEEYGEGFSVGDQITCYIDLSAAPATVSFSKNGCDIGQKKFVGDSKGKAFFPHVSVKNIKVSVTFGEQAQQVQEEVMESESAAPPVAEQESHEMETAQVEQTAETAPPPSTEDTPAVPEGEKMAEESSKVGENEQEEKTASVDEANSGEEDKTKDEKQENNQDTQGQEEAPKQEEKEKEPVLFKPIQQALAADKQRAPCPPPSKSSCEVIVVIGLPASGKTTWAQKHCQENPDKNYELLGTDMILDKMGLGRVGWKENYEVLLKQANEILNNVLMLASNSKRNYIIDQCNVYRSSQERKVGYFKEYHRKAVVVIPPHHELRRRRAERRGLTGYEMLENDLKAMKANFFIPHKTDGVFDEVNFSEIYGNAAEKIVSQYKDDAMDVPYFPPMKRGRYDNRNRGWGGGGGGGYYQKPRQSYGGYHHGGYNQYNHYGSPHSSYYSPPPPPPRSYGGYYHHPPPPPRPYPQYHHNRPSPSFSAQRGGRYSQHYSRQSHYGQPGPRGGGGGYYNRY